MYSLTSNIKTGDIVLIRGSAKHSKVISLVTKGHFSHACLVVGNHEIIEALGDSGVQYTSPIKFIIKNISNIAVLRPKFSDNEQANSVRLRIDDIAKGHQSRAYNLSDAVKSVLHRKKPTHTDKYFCSHLVASIYREAGFPLTNKKDHNVTPNDFLKTSLLYDITNESVALIPNHITEKLLEADNNVFIDSGGETTSTTALILRSFLEKLKSIFKEYNIFPPSNMFDVIDTLTNPANDNIAMELDLKITAVYDSLNVMDNICKDNTTAYVHIDEYETQIKKYGQVFVDDEIKYHIYLINHLDDKHKTYASYYIVYDTIHNDFKLEYASRMCEYYTFILKAISDVKETANSRIDLLRKYQNEKADDSGMLCQLLSKTVFDGLDERYMRLAKLMSDISERSVFAVWLLNLEYDLWYGLHQEGNVYGDIELNADDKSRLRQLSKDCGSWIVYIEGLGLRPVPLVEWARHCSVRKANRGVSP